MSWAGYAGVSLLLLVIWGATSIASGHLQYFWPVWFIGPVGAVILVQSLTGGRWRR
jgi:hypothetical protein